VALAAPVGEEAGGEELSWEVQDGPRFEAGVEE
jgi:hypothetical protein